MNYFVPNFGVDKDIKNTLGHISAAEKRLNHKWTPDLKKKTPLPMNYFVPNFGLD